MGAVGLPRSGHVRRHRITRNLAALGLGVLAGVAIGATAGAASAAPSEIGRAHV